MEIGNPIHWDSVGHIASRSYSCGCCGKTVGPDRGWHGSETVQLPGYRTTKRSYYIYVCGFCGGPTLIGTGTMSALQVPSPLPARGIKHPPDEIKSMFNEAQSALVAGAPTAAVMVCRKVLMNLAVREGADENQSFLAYVDWLEQNGFVPPRGRPWVDQIRKAGNEATHEIPDIDRERAERVLSFTEGLLRFAYELPGALNDESTAD